MMKGTENDQHCMCDQDSNDKGMQTGIVLDISGQITTKFLLFLMSEFSSSRMTMTMTHSGKVNQHQSDNPSLRT